MIFNKIYITSIYFFYLYKKIHTFNLTYQQQNTLTGGTTTLNINIIYTITITTKLSTKKTTIIIYIIIYIYFYLENHNNNQITNILYTGIHSNTVYNNLHIIYSIQSKKKKV